MLTSSRITSQCLIALGLALLVGGQADAYINLGFRSRAEYDRYVKEYVSDCREKLASCTAAIERDPKSAEAWLARGKAWMSLPDFKGDRLPNDLSDRWEKAESDFQRAVHLEPKLGKAWIQLGIVSSGMKQRDALRKAVELDAKAPMAHALLALSLTAPAGKDRRVKAPDNDPASAVEHAKKACELTMEKDRRYLQVLAVVCSRARDFDGAVRAQKKVVALTPAAPESDPLAGREVMAAKAFLELYEKKQDISDLPDAYTPYMEAFLMLRRSVQGAP